MAAGFRNTSAFTPAFEKLLGEFVRDRNYFIHEFWVDRLSSKKGVGTIPSVEDYEGILHFISQLAENATKIENVFEGLLLNVLYQIGMDNWPDKIDEIAVGKWRVHLEDFRAVLRTPEDNQD
jgi:hypothetical protein